MHGHIESCYLQYMKRKERVLDNTKQFSGPSNAKNLTNTRVTWQRPQWKEYILQRIMREKKESISSLRSFCS